MKINLLILFNLLTVVSVFTFSCIDTHNRNSVKRNEVKQFQIDSINKYDLSKINSFLLNLKKHEINLARKLLFTDDKISYDNLKMISKDIDSMLSLPQVEDEIQLPKGVIIQKDTLILNYGIKENLTKWRYNLHRIQIKVDHKCEKIYEITLPGSTYYSTGGFFSSKKHSLDDIEDLENDDLLLFIRGKENCTWGTIINYSKIDSISVTNSKLIIKTKANIVYELSLKDSLDIEKYSKILKLN